MNKNKWITRKRTGVSSLNFQFYYSLVSKIFIYSQKWKVYNYLILKPEAERSPNLAKGAQPASPGARVTHDHDRGRWSTAVPTTRPALTNVGTAKIIFVQV